MYMNVYECKTEEDMATAETLVLSKLKPYKEQANIASYACSESRRDDRDRFILPENTHISLFIDLSVSPILKLLMNVSFLCLQNKKS